MVYNIKLDYFKFILRGIYMAIRNIVTEEDPVLRKRSREIKTIDDRIKTLAEDMIETLHSTENGIGLAAPQVGVLKRIFVIDMGEGDGPTVFINPEVITKEGSYEHTEGCLSVPDVWNDIYRPTYMKVKALNLDGEEFEFDGEDLLAACLEHETDHLNGMLYLDRLEKQELGIDVE